MRQKGEPSEDVISRQAAIDALKGLPTWWADAGGYYGGAQPPMVALLDPEDAVSAIENLPSAQPETSDAVYRLYMRAYEAGQRNAQPEIVRCRDCKHYQFADNRAFGFPVKRCEWTGFEDVDDDDFCSRGERKDE